MFFIFDMFVRLWIFKYRLHRIVIFCRTIVFDDRVSNETIGVRFIQSFLVIKIRMYENTKSYVYEYREYVLACLFLSLPFRLCLFRSVFFARFSHFLNESDFVRNEIVSLMTLLKKQ